LSAAHSGSFGGMMALVKKKSRRALSAGQKGGRENCCVGHSLNGAEQFLLPTYKRQPWHTTAAARTFRFNWKKVSDFLAASPLNALRPRASAHCEVIRREAGARFIPRISITSYQGPARRKLSRLSGMDRVFFSNSARSD